jgi:hypothetical protein
LFSVPPSTASATCTPWQSADGAYYADEFQAHAMRRQIGEALRCLKEAEQLTPEQTRTHRVARAVARELIQLSGSRPRPELRELAETLGVLP